MLTNDIDIKCFSHKDNDLISFCVNCNICVCLVCICSKDHQGHVFSLIEKDRVEEILDEFKNKTFQKSQKYKEENRDKMIQLETIYNKVKSNHQINQNSLSDKFKHLHQILQILELDIKRNLETILSDNEETYIKIKSLLENDITTINKIISKHSHHSSTSIPPTTTIIDYQINSVFNNQTKQHLSIIKDNHQLVQLMVKNDNQFNQFKETTLLFNNDIIDSIKSTLKSIYTIKLKNYENEIIVGEESNNNNDDDRDIKNITTSPTSTTTTTTTNYTITNNINNLASEIPQENNKLFQFKIHYREVYNLPIIVEAFLISKETLSADDNLVIMVIVSPKDIQTTVPKGTKILLSNKYYGSQLIEIPNTLDLHNNVSHNIVPNNNNSNFNTPSFKKLITFDESHRNNMCSFQPMLNIKIQFPTDIGVSYFSYMYPNISWFLGDLHPIRPITIGLEGCSGVGKTSILIGLINLFNLSNTIQQNFSEENGGNMYFQTNRITYRSIKSIIASKYSEDQFSKSFLKNFDISFLDTWGLLNDNDIELKYKVQGKVYNNLAINERTGGISNIGKPEFCVDLFLFVVSLKNFKDLETMKRIEKRINEAIALGTTPVLAITFSDTVSTSEYTSLVGSYKLPVQSSNIFKIINYNDLEIRKENLEKDLLFFRMLNRIVQLCNIKKIIC